MEAISHMAASSLSGGMLSGLSSSVGNSCMPTSAIPKTTPHAIASSRVGGAFGAFWSSSLSSSLLPSSDSDSSSLGARLDEVLPRRALLAGGASSGRSRLRLGFWRRPPRSSASWERDERGIFFACRLRTAPRLDDIHASLEIGACMHASPRVHLQAPPIRRIAYSATIRSCRRHVKKFNYRPTVRQW